MTNRLTERRQEFRRFVWNHAEDQFQAKFDHRTELDTNELKILKQLLTPRSLDSLDEMSRAIIDCIQADQTRLRLLLQMTGLTRNKIVQDIKAFARNADLSISTSSPESLFNSPQGRHAASSYLARQLIRVFGRTRKPMTTALLEAVNQATWLGYIRQERAKRMGHEAEYRLACMLKGCGVPFEPLEKAENPLCRDAHVDGISYDLVVPDSSSALLRVKATVHTANIGQYGQSKDHLEMQEAAASIRKAANREQVVLLAFIDGVGFESNRRGLDGVLRNADEFCQFRTLWKAAGIAASVIGVRLDIMLPPKDHKFFAVFCERYDIRIANRKHSDKPLAGWVEAGDARVKIR